MYWNAIRYKLDVCVPISAAWPVYKESNSQQNKYENIINASMKYYIQLFNSQCFWAKIINMNYMDTNTITFMHVHWLQKLYIQYYAFK